MDHLRSDPSGWDLLQTVLGEFALPMAVMDDSYQLIHVGPALENLADTVPPPGGGEAIVCCRIGECSAHMVRAA
jgi:hypothetical protein